ncbi:hypothetical protein [Acetivibrio clariflavus]|uniref:Uncharacterized protein n=1 Tax=Acetivibrio clariflavus (strain DSM 19732 / NBRC 101661 / EBR45) TaxID=720554 RepID=G8M2Q9_ACECE|nr:hypothetical protein [Acetivibrio clariflavus]AEV67133.1 hypothetical protein Clocl_0404 [Acetivibrio clariflavus DSM 19732]HPU41371.1 hypothetical protein [Acetivibrio clariflavus]
MVNPLKRLIQSRRGRHSGKFDRKLLKKNDIHLLILDERWNGLFKDTDKTVEILECEKKIRELLKREASLTSELKELNHRKKVCMDTIIKLTSDVFDKNDEQAKEKMHSCEKEIKYINKRVKEIEEELEISPDKLKDANLELLEHTVNTVYFKMRRNQKRYKQLEKLIEETSQKLKEYTEEMEALCQDDTDVYSYFHDLLGGEELEKLDKEYFGESFTALRHDKSADR